MVSGKTILPPYWSVQTPRNRRTSDPVRIGVPTSRPNWVSFRPSSALISIPMIAKIVQTAKQIGEGKVLRPRAPVLLPGIDCCCNGMASAPLSWVDGLQTCAMLPVRA
jgi:hypothetical protein